MQNDIEVVRAAVRAFGGAIAFAGLSFWSASAEVIEDIIWDAVRSDSSAIDIVEAHIEMTAARMAEVRCKPRKRSWSPRRSPLRVTTSLQLRSCRY